MRNHNFLYTAGLLWLCAFTAIRLTFGLIEVEEAESGMHNLLVSCLRSGSDALWLTAPYVYLRLCRRKWASVCLGILWAAGWCLTAWITVWYARHFGTPIHYTDLTLTQNLNGLEDSVLATVQCRDFLIAIPVMLGVGVWIRSIGHAHTYSYPQRKGLRQGCMCFTFLLAANGALFALTLSRHDYVETGTDRNLVLKHYGIFHLIRYDRIGQLRPSPNEIAWAKAFYETHRRSYAGQMEPVTVHKKKNLIVILVESLPSWVIDKTINGMEITPNLNRIIREDSVLYWRNMIPQTRSGRSSDAQLLINTGLLPTRTGTVANIYAHQPFPGLPKALAMQGYKSYNFICDHASFWNQKATSRAYGFDTLYDKVALAQSEKNLPDSMMFALAVKELQKVPEPFYAQLVTLSSHCPYEASNCPDPASPFLHTCPDPEASYFLTAIHYTDRCIGQFIAACQQNGLASRSVIAITGDHEDYTLNRLEGRAEAVTTDYAIPFILLGCSQKAEHTDKTVAQADIYPTLLYLTGCAKYGFTGFGENLFGTTTGAALTRKDEITGKDISAHKAKELHDRQAASDILIRGNVFKGF